MDQLLSSWRRWLPRLYLLVLVLILLLSVMGALTQKASAAAWVSPASKTSVTIHFRGTTTRTTSTGETAGELLQRLGLEVSGEDVVSHGLEEPVFGGMELRIDRVITAEERYTARIPHEVIRCHDASLPEGAEQILTPGEDGELLCRTEVTYINGQETARTLLSQAVTRSPVTEVVGVGTGEGASGAYPRPVIRDGFITLPTGEVLTYTGTATVRATAYTHTDKGCDFITATGTAVRWGTVAVDPRYIPYGTRMFIAARNGSYIYGIAVAEDCGGDIKGDRMDLYMPTYEQCMEFGRRVCTVYFLG